jgi:20S proteasome alpha/beta subunit
MYYNNMNGAIVVSDSRLLRGYDYTVDQKIFEIVKDQVVFSAAGMSGISDQLICGVQDRLRGNESFEGVVKTIEDVTSDLWYRYKNPNQPRFGPNDVLVDGIIGGVVNRQPKLYHLIENGFAEPISNFLPVGDGARHADNLVKNLYNPSIPKMRAMQICIHALIQTARIDTAVDDNPQVAIIEDRHCALLNLDESGNFSVNNSQLAEIKTKINGIAGKQAKTFHLCLDGNDEQKRKLDEILKDYEQNSNSSLT